MAETRGVERMVFGGSGQQSITVDSDEFINLIQLDIGVDTDTNFSVTCGSTEILGGNLIADATPAQFFTYDFGRGRGTGVKGDALTVQLGAAGKVFVAYIKFSN